MVRLLARPDLAHGDRAIHEAVGPRAVQVEEADGFRREQARVRNEVFERYSDEEAKVSEKGLQIRRQLRLRLRGAHLVGLDHALSEGFPGKDRRDSHGFSSRRTRTLVRTRSRARSR